MGSHEFCSFLNELSYSYVLSRDKAAASGEVASFQFMGTIHIYRRAMSTSATLAADVTVISASRQQLNI